MKLFELQTDLTSYAYPIIKIPICLSVVILSIVRNSIFRFSSSWANAVVTILCLALTLASIPCLYISIGELFHTYANRRKRRNVNCKSIDVKLLPVKKIIEIVSRDDIVEIEACVDNRIITIGASAVCEPPRFIFEDKSFYISNTEYETIELFADALNDLFPKGEIPVFRIDGLNLNHYRV